MAGLAPRTEDDYISNSGWVTRIKGFFDQVDQNKIGTIEVANFATMLDHIHREIKPDPAVYEHLRRVILEEHIVAMGVTPGKKLTKDEYIKNMAKMAGEEHSKRMKGEKMSLAKVNDALFDVFDLNHDGVVTLEEFKVVMRIVYGCNDEEAEASFRLIDTNKNGTIEREELTDYEINYWFGLDDEATKGLYGAKFEI